MGKGGRYLKKVSGRRGGKVLFSVLLVLVLLVLGIAGAAIGYYNYVLDQIPKASTADNSLSAEELEAILGNQVGTIATTEETEPPTTAATEAKDPDYGKTGKIVNIMVVGQNYREGEASKLSDTMILCTVNKETRTLTLTSFLRDLYVQLPNYKTYTCGMQRINVAYNLGWHWGGDAGAFEMLDNCIKNNFGVEIDYNIEINFDGFIDLIDLIGGVTVELSQAEADYLNSDPRAKEDQFHAGENHLNGKFALAYARMRKSTPEDNDFHRSSRQRELIGIILDQLSTLSLGELNELVQTALPYVLTDMTNEEITTLALELLPLLPELQMVSNQCPAEGTYSGQMVEIYDVMSGVLVPNLQQNRALLTAITEEAAAEETAE